MGLYVPNQCMFFELAGVGSFLVFSLISLLPLSDLFATAVLLF